MPRDMGVSLRQARGSAKQGATIRAEVKMWLDHGHCGHMSIFRDIRAALKGCAHVHILHVWSLHLGACLK